MIAYDQAELAQALLSEIGDALFLLDPETDRVLEVNSASLQLTGFSRAEVLQFSATHLFRSESAGGIQRLEDAFTKTMVFHGQDGFLLRTKDDNWVSVSLKVSRLHLAPKTLGLIIARDDRERRAASAQVRRVEAELRTVLDSSPAALWSAERVPGPDVFAGWQFLYVSPLLARIAGRPAEYFDHPFKWAEVIHPTEREVYRVALSRLLTESEDLEQLYRVQTPDGVVRWVRDRLQVVRDASGRPARLDGCLTDVTEQRAAEAAVRQSEERFRALVEKGRDGILLLDKAANIRYATSAAKFILGFEPAALLGLVVFAFVHPDDIPTARMWMAHCWSQPGEDVPFTFRAITADGTTRLIEMNGVNRLDDPSVQAVVVNYHDVTEHERVARELVEQQTLLEGLIASIPDIVCYKDREGRFLGCNPAFEALSGRPAAGVIGLRCDELFTAEWVARIRAVEQIVLSTGRTERGKEWVSYPDGRKSLLDIVLAPLRDAAGATSGLIIVGRDVTEQDRLEEELRQSYKMEAVGRLASGIAHDSNNLLAVVLGNLELVQRGAATRIEATGLLLSTERAAKHAAELNKQILRFARRQPLRRVTVDLNAIVRESLDLLRRSIGSWITIRFSPDPNLRPVVADPIQLQQVLMNLCLNARDAMPDGGTLALETADADLSGDANGARRFVRLSVSDTGTGMTEDVRAKIFDPFYTTKAVGQGTGLGLAVVDDVAQAHGGSVAVASTPGTGSRFDVYLLRGTTSEELTPALTAPERCFDFPQGRGEIVLVVDDDPGIRDLARIVLELSGYHVLVAADGAEAVEAFEKVKGQVKLAVLDARMPKLSGRQVFEAIRRADPAVKVLFTSGNHGGGVLSADDLPGTRRLNKPYVPSQLAAAVQEMLSE